MKKILAYAAAIWITFGTAFAFLKLGQFLSSRLFSDDELPSILACATGCYIGYLMAIALLRGAGFEKETQ